MIYFIGGQFPPSMQEELRNNSKGNVDNAADTLQKAMIAGLKLYYGDLRSINLPFIGSFPYRYKKSYIKNRVFSKKLVNVGFNNISGYKLYSRYINLEKFMVKNIDMLDQNIFFVYSCHLPFLKAVAKFKHLSKRSIICLIVPDLPGFFEERKNFIARNIRRLEKYYFSKYVKMVDGFVLLSEPMHEILGVGQKPWVLVEGVYSELANPVNSLKDNTKNTTKTILYTGTLKKRYGILDLLKAFQSISDPTYCLQICGEGEAKNEILSLSAKDTRIHYLGLLPRDQIIALQKEATVLVNPRTSDGEYTKYSFPSKTMEYLASGTATILHKLPGMPEEYFQYCFVPRSESINDLKEKIIEVCEMDEKLRNEISIKAQKFILKEKTPQNQCQKIYNMLNQILILKYKLL